MTELATPVAILKQRLDELCIEQPQGFIRLSTPCQIEHLIGWLNVQSVFPRLYWKARELDAPEYAMVGVVKALDSLAALHSDQYALAAHPGEQPDYFGGMAFDPTTPGWANFNHCYFLLPRIELKRCEQGTMLSLNLRFDDRDREQELADAHAALDALNPPRPLSPLLPLSLERNDCPSREEWAAQVSRVTQPDQLCRTPKVVLSRETCLRSAEIPSPLGATVTLAGRGC